MDDSSQEKPKIIVDDDWKVRAQAEKEELQKQVEAKRAQANSKTDENETPLSLPPASFTVLVTMLASQVMASLGQTPDLTEGKPVVRPDLAKHYIDTLGMLEEKTKGNLSLDESTMLGNLLHELRMLFVATENHTANSASDDSP